MSFAPLAFTGISSYSSDFQTVLSRAVSIASLPLKKLQNDDTDLIQKKQLLGSFNGALTGLADSLTAIGRVAQGKGLQATSSDTSKVTVTNTGAESAATYTISDITSIATVASETSVSGYASSTAAPVSSTGTLKLVAGSTEYTITLTPSTNNLVGLRDAINHLGAGVTATVLTTGTGAEPNYLSVTQNNLGAKALKIFDDPDGANTNLLTTANQGSNAEFKINGVPVSKGGNLVNDVVPGTTFTILGTTAADAKVALTLVTDRSQLASAISSFASAYNSVVDQVNGQVGPSAGLLSGDFLVRQVQKNLREITNFQGAGGDLQNLSDLGITLDAQGKISFDTDGFKNLSDSKITSAFQFLGTRSTGFGALASKLEQLSDPVTGLVKAQQDSYDQADRRIQDQITSLTDRITELQSTINLRLQQADALLAQLTSQQTVLAASINAVNYSSFGKQTG
jgi:flagellar hook-associated protein 2